MSDDDPHEIDVSIRRIRRSRELRAVLEPHEPRSTPIIVDVAALGLVPWRMRAWAVERDRAVAAVVVLTRAAFDRWFARIVLIDPVAAPAVADIIDRSIAWSVTASGLDLGPVQAHLRRSMGLYGMPWVVVEDPAHVVEIEPDDSLVRVAGRRDRAALRALYRGYELAVGDTWWQERSAMRTYLRSRTILVAVIEGSLVGAVMLGGPTDRYLTADRLTVLPAHRGRGLSWEFVAHMQRLANARHVGGTASIAGSNPMEFSDDHLSTAWWCSVLLRPPHRWRGQRRLRALYERFGHVARRPATVVRDVDPAVPPNRTT